METNEKVSRGTSKDLDLIADKAWRVSPDMFAKLSSAGRWKPYKHLMFAADIIRPAIMKGNARIIVSMPPRHGKSEFVTHWIPTWFLDNWPDKRIIITSYADALARTFGRKVRNELESNRFVRTKLPHDKTAAGSFETMEGGGLITAGIGGPITGKGGDLCIIDDPIKNQEEAMSETIRENHVEWFKSTLYTRLEPQGSIILVMTRWHQDDLAGWLLNNHSDNWIEIKLPALAEESDPMGRPVNEPLCVERYDAERLGEIRKAIGERSWNALYQQRPAPIEGAIWKRSNWKRWTKLPEGVDTWIQSWDMNTKEGGSSNCVGQVWAKKAADKFLVYQIKGKWGITETIGKVRMVSEMFPQAVKKLIENKANGPAIEDTLKREIAGIVLVEPQGGKLTRALAVEPEIESGNVYIPSPDLGYDWVDEFVEEAATFPNGQNDDQVDAASQALLELRASGTFTTAWRDDPTKLSKLRKGR